MIRKSILFILGAFFLLTVIFQNCTEPKVVLSDIVTQSSVTKMSLSASICSDVSFLKDENNNFLFIIDLSRSNIGSFREDMINLGGNNYPVYYWDPTTGTDVNGDRFTAIETFITSCADSINNKFAVIGFGEKAGSVQYDNKNRPYLSCSDPVSFKSKDDVIADLRALKQAEQEEANYYTQWLTEFYDEPLDQQSLALSFTSYSDAADCANRVILKDLVDSYEKQVDAYQVFFLSDGRPADSKNSVNSCSEVADTAKDACYTENLLSPFSNSIAEVSAVRRGINILTIGYGISDASDFKFLDALASIQRNAESEKLDNFENNSGFLCDLITSRIGVETNSDSLMTTVLTLGQRNGDYIADSDIDGVFDPDEVLLGYDPKNPRSKVSGVLDGVCELVGGISQCNIIRSQVTCQETKLLSGGFSDCDVEVIKESRKGLNLDNSSDWDKDGVPNFIEVVKGTDPFIDDMNDDPDNDGLSTRYEIMRSKNPFEHDNLTPAELAPVIVSNESAKKTPDCDNKTRYLVLEQVPFFPSLAVGTGMTTEMLHRKNEHVVAVFSSRRTQNYVLQDRGIIGKFVQMNVDSNSNSPFLIPAISELTNVDFEDWTQ